MLLVTALEAAQATVFEESELCIEFAPDARHFRDTLSKPDNNKFVRDACREVTGKEMGVRIVVKDPKAEGEPLSREDEERLEKQRLREMAENSPVVQTDAEDLSRRDRRRAARRRRSLNEQNARGCRMRFHCGGSLIRCVIQFWRVF